MKDATPAAVRLSDYRPFGWTVEHVHLTIRLDPGATRVVSRIAFVPDPDVPARGPFKLDGIGLRLVRATIDGRTVEPAMTSEGLACDVPDGPFVWEAEVEIAPQDNTRLEGLYMSKGMYCTQCEAEGFRRITYYPDRPDVMAPFTVRIEGDAPVLLSNGNPGPSGPGFAEWHDPWPKPSYLFALVAGDLRAHRDAFTTRSGRRTDLAVWVRPGDEDRCTYAMDALKRAMRWDEEVYGREYDLDVFNIVAVDDFNMGAMENKGLNVFNSKYVLASPETATDADYANIEAIVAHEYFHNWTGNRITCRDWFQLCLKEGLTVFRDQQFSGDMRGHEVRRIEDVRTLRARQFPEDAGPLAHPVRPNSYVEINNFYTATVYEKGAELIGMLRRLVGPDAYDRALSLYFDRHDGRAATIEDWLAVFAEATGRDMGPFMRWYDQAGTPRVTVRRAAADGRLQLSLRQETPPTPGQPRTGPVPIPVALGFVGRDGTDAMATRTIVLTEAETSADFDVPADAVPSLLRGFSAPVILEANLDRAERLVLLAHDTDPFNRWEAGRGLAREALLAMALDGAGPDTAYLGALDRMLGDDALAPDFRALLLGLPGDAELAQAIAERGAVPDPDVIDDARSAMLDAMAARLAEALARQEGAMAVSGPYRPDPRDAARRSLRNACAGLLARLDGAAAAADRLARADNMTDEIAMLALVVGHGADPGPALTRFHERWRHDALVLDKWFAVQIARAPRDRAVPAARELTAHPAFDWRNPNRFRAVIGALGGHHAGFHLADGAGYDLVADWLIRLDPVNPQTAARMTTVFETWRQFDPGRQAKAASALSRIAAAPGLSRDVAEMVGRMHADP